MSEATKIILLSVSNAFSGFTDEEGDLTKKGMVAVAPFVVMAILIILYLDGPV